MIAEVIKKNKKTSFHLVFKGLLFSGLEYVPVIDSVFRKNKKIQKINNIVYCG
jgi:hypothetical protein